MFTKEKVKKFFAVALMGYLAVSVIQSFFSLVNHIVDVASNTYYSFSFSSALQYVLNMLAYLAMLALVASVAMEALKGLRSVTEKLWFLPAILRALSVFVSLISFFVSLRYMHGAWNWISSFFMEFLWLVETALYLAACWLLFPKALFVYEVEPVFKKKAPAAPAAPAYGYAPYGQQPYAAPQQPYAQQPYAAPQQPYAQQPYAAPQQDAYAQQPYAAPQQPPYAQQPFAAPQQNPYAQQPYAAPQDPSAPNGQ